MSTTALSRLHNYQSIIIAASSSFLLYWNKHHHHHLYLWRTYFCTVLFCAHRQMIIPKSVPQFSHHQTHKHTKVALITWRFVAASWCVCAAERLAGPEVPQAGESCSGWPDWGSCCWGRHHCCYSCWWRSRRRLWTPRSPESANPDPH